MNFASPLFLFAFLPLVLIAYHLLRPMQAKNALLIAAGLVFYAFGDLRHLPLLLASGIVTGAFTGLAAQSLTAHLRRLGMKFD